MLRQHSECPSARDRLLFNEQQALLEQTLGQHCAMSSRLLFSRPEVNTHNAKRQLSLGSTDPWMKLLTKMNA